MAIIRIGQASARMSAWSANQLFPPTTGAPRSSHGCRGGRQRVRVGDDPQPARHAGRVDEDARKEQQRPHKHIDGIECLRSGCFQPDEDAYPEHCYPKKKQQSEGSESSGDGCFGAPPEGEARRCDDRERDEGVQQVGDATSSDDGDAAHGQGTEPVGDPTG